jgi:hypothetical protein
MRALLTPGAASPTLAAAFARAFHLGSYGHGKTFLRQDFGNLVQSHPGAAATQKAAGHEHPLCHNTVKVTFSHVTHKAGSCLDSAAGFRP